VLEFGFGVVVAMATEEEIREVLEARLVEVVVAPYEEDPGDELNGYVEVMQSGREEYPIELNVARLSDVDHDTDDLATEPFCTMHLGVEGARKLADLLNGMVVRFTGISA
jgi:hypothetical protein